MTYRSSTIVDIPQYQYRNMRHVLTIGSYHLITVGYLAIPEYQSARIHRCRSIRVRCGLAVSEHSCDIHDCMTRVAVAMTVTIQSDSDGDRETANMKTAVTAAVAMADRLQL